MYKRQNQAIVKGKEKKIMKSFPGLLISNCFVDADTTIQAGKPIYSIDSKSLQTMIDQKKADLKVVQSQIQEAQSQKNDTINSNTLNYNHAVENYNAALAYKNSVLDTIQNAIDILYSEKDRLQQEVDNLRGEYNQNPSDELKILIESKSDELRNLSQSIYAKEAEYEQTMTEQDLSIQTARQQMEQASNSNTVLGDTAIVQSIITEEQLKKELEELQQYENDTVVKAPCDMIIDEINIHAGQITSEIADLTYFEINNSCEVVTTFVTEDLLPIRQGEIVEIAGTKEKLSLPITSTRMLEDGQGIEITIDLENTPLKVGNQVTIVFQSEPKGYDCILPREALHYDAEDSYSLYVLETKKTVLGNELIAKKQEVMVLDKNETQIAVEGIGSETEVITSYTKSLNEGDTVQKYDE